MPSAKYNSFEGFTLGAQPTTATSGGASGDAFSTALWTGGPGAIVDTPVIHGSKCLRFITTSTSGVSFVEFTVPGSRWVAARAYFIFTDFPTVATRLFDMRTASSTTSSCTFNTDGTLSAGSLVGTPVGRTSGVITLNHIYEVNFLTVSAATPTTSNGRIAQRIRNVTTDTIFHDFDSANQANTVGVGTEVVSVVRAGAKANTNTALLTCYMDSFAAQEGLDAFIESVATPTLTFASVTTDGVVLGGQSATTALSDTDAATKLRLTNGKITTGRIPTMAKPAGDWVLTIGALRPHSGTGSLSVILKDGTTTVATATVTGTVGLVESNLSATFTAASLSGIAASKFQQGQLDVVITATAA